MKKREVINRQHEIEDATPAEKPGVVQSIIMQCKAELENMEEQLRFLLEQFKRKFNHWMMQDPENLNRPVVISQDRQEAKKTRLFAWAGLLIEILLSIWIFVTTLGISWFLGAIIAILLSVFVHVLILTLFRNQERPRETLRKIKKIVFIPSLLIFVISMSITLFVRTVSGPLALLLAPFFGILLWGSTISLIALVGSLFSIAHLFDWSYRDFKEYVQLEKEKIITDTFLSKVLQEQDKLNGGVK